MQLNASRIKVLQAQDDLVNSMKEAASKELLNVSHHQNHHIYKKLLQDLIVQVLWLMKIRCTSTPFVCAPLPPPLLFQELAGNYES